MNKRKHTRCCMCDYPIYLGDDTHDADRYYIINEDVICEDCLRDYANKFCKGDADNE